MHQTFKNLINGTEKEVIKTCEDLSENLKRCRTQSGLTQEQTAKELDVEFNYYQYIEDGNLMPSIFKLIRLSEIFGVEFSEIIYKK